MAYTRKQIAASTANPLPDDKAKLREFIEQATQEWLAAGNTITRK